MAALPMLLLGAGSAIGAAVAFMGVSDIYNSTKQAVETEIGNDPDTMRRQEMNADREKAKQDQSQREKAFADNILKQKQQSDQEAFNREKQRQENYSKMIFNK